jgi:predicted aspartyl protease
MDQCRGGTVRDEMGTFRVDIELENPARPGAKRVLAAVLVDTGAELSWVPAEVLESLGVARNNRWRLRQADGTVLERWTGSVLVRVLGKHAADEVVFGEPGDLVLLGARTLEGLNYRVDPVTRRLVDAGPAPAATRELRERLAARARVEPRVPPARAVRAERERG